MSAPTMSDETRGSRDREFRANALRWFPEVIRFTAQAALADRAAEGAIEIDLRTVPRVTFHRLAGGDGAAQRGGGE